MLPRHGEISPVCGIPDFFGYVLVDNSFISFMKNMIAPLSCTELYGQEKAQQLLAKALAKKRLPHSLLFSGPDGVGKYLFARGLAAALCCRQNGPASLAACGTCPACGKIRSGNHPDFQTITSQKGGIRIARIRQLIKELEYPPYEAAIRVVVLRDVDEMGREAANALLKTLEEPRSSNLLVLLADSSRPLLATISSRCQKIPFAPLSLADTARILEAEGVPGEEARLLARFSSGSPGQALRLHSAGIVLLWQQIVDFVSHQQKNASDEVMGVLAFAEKMAALKDDLPLLLGLFRRWLRDLLLADEESLSCYRTDSGRRRSKVWSSSELSARMKALDRAERALARNCQRGPVCEVLLFAFQ
ncbi:MAG: DNA polymerase III subunit delta' [Deltaproteobacteria bacterium]|nr:MAG: DNA polymerase III subunit delta' [Deltaproteobacteria bacterium]